VAKLVKLLVTGAAGFIGFHAARRLLERGDELVGLDNLNACDSSNGILAITTRNLRGDRSP
jgi:nucleoside-diphosphate-sugar epimerase